MKAQIIQKNRYIFFFTLLFIVISAWSVNIFKLKSLSVHANKGTSFSQGQESEMQEIIYSAEVQILSLSKNILVKNAIKDFKKCTYIKKSLGKIAGNDYHINQRKPHVQYSGHAINTLFSNDVYKYHPVLKAYCDKFSFIDIMLVDAQSNQVIYSSKLQPYLGHVINNKRYKTSNLYKLITSVSDIQVAKMYTVNEFEEYDTGLEAYIAAPIKDSDQLLGIIVFRLSMEEYGNVIENKNRLFTSTGF